MTRVRQTTVLVVDARPGGRARRRAALEAGGLEVCAETATVTDAIAIAERQEPDICLIDAHVEGAIEAVAAIAARVPASRVVIVGGSANGHALEALAAGAAGYLVGRDPPRLADVLERVRAGEVAIPRALAASLVSEFRRRTARARIAARLADRGLRLTAQEWNVLELLGESRATAEIARELGISPVTVRSHAASVVRKLGVADREEARRVFADAA
jgi:DNA-binding NarL/FixJ family response regulator